MELKLALMIIGCNLLILTATVGCDDSTCSDTTCKNVPKIYEEVGCTPTKDTKTDCCATSFKCPDFNAYDKSKCFLKGKAFNINETASVELLPSCSRACKCIAYDGQPASFTCADVDCPENDGARDWSCVSQYDNLNSCCRSNEVCGKAKINELPICVYEGQTYRLGQQIEPKNEPCYQCLCTEDFNNATSLVDNKNCAKINCGFELHYMQEIKSGCVPVNLEKRCCPIQFKCPSDHDVIAPDSRTHNSSESSCKFGDLILMQGDQLQMSDNCMNCTCEVPPFITCTQTYNC